MLTSFPRTSAPLRASPTSSPRRKGAQPGNRNAFRHGLYSAHSRPAGLTPKKSASARKDPAVLEKELQERLVASCKKGLREDRRILAQCLARSMPGTPLEGILPQVRAATLVTGRILKIERYLFELGGRQEHIRSLARNVPALLRWEFSELGILPRPAFVPRKIMFSHANLNWEAPRLLDTQWQLLEETLTAQRADMDYFRKYRRRKPLPSARFLLEGILWKLANGLPLARLGREIPGSPLPGALYRPRPLGSHADRLQPAARISECAWFSRSGGPCRTRLLCYFRQSCPACPLRKA